MFNRPKFIVFEGIDGSGTTTQAQMLAKAINKEAVRKGMGEKAVLSPEPTDGEIGRLIRSILGGKSKISRETNDELDKLLACLFSADRADHVHNKEDGILAQLENGKNVISTRYYFSTLVYNVNTDQDRRIIKSINQWFPEPDLIFILDLDESVACDRLKDRSELEIYEYKEKLREARLRYKDIAHEYNKKSFCFDATLSPEDIHNMVWSTLLYADLNN